MVLNYINGKVVIGRVYDRFPINFHGWEVRAAYWIAQGLKKLGLAMAYEQATVPATLEEFKCRIPDKAAYIRAISWNGYRINRIGKINRDPIQDLPILYDSEYWYDISTDGYIISNLEEGDIRIYVYKYLEDFDAETAVWYPRVPDNEEVLESLDYYIAMRLLQKGHDIKGYSLSINNPLLNPGLAFENSKKAARNSAADWDEDELYQVSKIKRSFLLDYNHYTQGNYNPNYYEA